MSIRNSLFLLFRKYSFFRLFSYIFVIAVVLIIVSVATVQSKKIPFIESVVPAVGSPGDTMTIRGGNFGDIRGTNYVEIGGNKITASNYMNWSDTLIQIVIPTNIQDGLVVVSTSSGKSKPGFFANETGIPVAVPPDTKTSMPVISGISPENGNCGSLITITGSNFGTARGTAEVFFTANTEETADGKMPGETAEQFDFQFISASPADFDYEYWSDSEIRVRIPDGATSGAVFVQTEKGKSNFFNEKITLSAGTKRYSSRKTYIVQITEDIDGTDPKNETHITLRVPRPQVLSWQPFVTLTECQPIPVIDNYKNTIIHQVDLPKASPQSRKIRFTQDFVVSTYAVSTTIQPRSVRPFTEKQRFLYKAGTEPDELVKSGNSEIIALAQTIVGKETNPYLNAKSVYDYMIDNFKLTDKLRKADSPPETILKSKKGDAYDFAIVYAELLRSLSIPAYPIAGILVDAELKTTSHWWCEFYIEGFGWIPIDISLGKGMEYNSFRTVESPRDFYFGNLDGQHIAFSKGWNEIKQPVSANSKTVYFPKTYALLSVWEESSSETVKYSSLWNVPTIAGVY